ncbi:MAG TPA: methyltransferase domain-containing protein [Bacteroidota bacterium]|nr:methyltransferase domain-containing protein [Bacteroidota bacterium]
MREKDTQPSALLFETIFSKGVGLLPNRKLTTGECQSLSGVKCSLCAAHKIDYEAELKAKNAALREFWNTHSIDARLDPLIASPLGRNYRVVSKRRVFSSRKNVLLGLIGSEDKSGGLSPMPVDRCMIEPDVHARIYRCIGEFLNRRESKEFTEAFNYIVVKGSYDEFTVIFNIAGVTPSMRQFVNRLSKHLTASVKGIIGIHFAIDEKQSGYYLPKVGRHEKQRYQKVHGKSEIFQKIFGVKFLFSPLSFTQTNLSILDLFIGTIIELCAFKPGDRLLDLYCGYGLFSLLSAQFVRTVTGVEISADAVEDAKSNASRLKVGNCNFLRGDINDEALEPIIASHHGMTKVILDPPRNGTKPGVIELIAGRNVERVVHIFCNIDLMPSELNRWKNSGYSIKRAIPFDMFPGTNDVEMITLLERAD